jgi:hypothetical protein
MSFEEKAAYEARLEALQKQKVIMPSGLILGANVSQAQAIGETYGLKEELRHAALSKKAMEVWLKH